MGFSLRVLLAPILGHAYDTIVWEAVYFDAIAGIDPYTGWDAFYAEYGHFVGGGYYAWPPAWFLTLLIFFIPVVISNLALLGPTPYENPLFFFLFRFWVKLPLIVADIILAKKIYDVAKAYKGEERALHYYKIVLFVPATFGISAIWGMFDALPALFSLLFLLYLIESRGEGPYVKQKDKIPGRTASIVKSAICLGLAINYKLYPAIFIPFTIPFIQERPSGKYPIQKLLFLTVVGVVNLALAFPFLFLESAPYLKFLGFHMGERVSQGMSWQAFLPYSLFLLTGMNAIDPAFASVVMWLASSIAKNILYVSYILLVVYYVLKEKNKQSFHTVLAYSMLSLCLFYLLSPVVNDQYILWIFPLGMLFIVLFNSPLIEKAWKIVLFLWSFLIIANSGFLRFITPDVMEMMTQLPYQELRSWVESGNWTLVFGSSFWTPPLNTLLPILFTIIMPPLFILYFLLCLFLSYRILKMAIILFKSQRDYSLDIRSVSSIK